MRSNLKLVINNPQKQIEERQFFEKDELKIILDLYAKMVSEGSWKDYGLSFQDPSETILAYKSKIILSSSFSKNCLSSICLCGLFTTSFKLLRISFVFIN
jgi:hypothetical protein